MARTFLVPATLALLLALMPAGQAGAAGAEGELPHAGTNIADAASLQRGARLFVNYCLSCHAADYMRYNRLVEDLGLSESMVMRNLVFRDAKIGDAMRIAMRPEDGEAWFGKTPPDLSLIGRSRGSDWLYAYMRSFYRDETGAWNNTILPNAAMPHVLWRLQGIQEPVYKTVTRGEREEQVIDHLQLVEPGTLSPEAYDRAMLDLVTFLEYLGEPAKVQRKRVGIWVMLYLALFAFIAWLLKTEYWRDVH